MPNDTLHPPIGWSVIRKKHGWFVVLPDESTELGPYLKGMLAMRVALAFVRPARRQALDAQVFVGSDRDQVHRCAMISHWGSRDPCHACVSTSTWQKRSCPLRSEMLATSGQLAAGS